MEVMESNSVNGLMSDVDLGLQGINQGLPNGMTRLNKYLHGIQKRRYYLLGADSGVGKTTLADFMVYNAYKGAKAMGKKLEIDYYSLEIPRSIKRGRITSLMYYLKYGKSLPTDYILGEQYPRVLTDQEYANVQAISGEIDEMFSAIWWHDSGITPTGIWKRLVDHASAHGSFTWNKESTKIVGYTPNVDVLRLTVIDHLALIDLEPGLNLKQSMDAASSYFVRARNTFGDSFLVIQQFNTEMQGAARERKSTMAYVPSRLDFGDSRYTYRDADVVMGLTRPSDFQLDQFSNFTELGRWGDYFVVNFLMKNRGLGANHGIPMFMNTVAGVPDELDSDNWSLLLQQLYIKKAEELDNLSKD